MPLASGTKLGPYEIVAPLGAGGMGEVYRARDTRLERTVAIKIVRAEHSSDGELRQRLEREAKAISALNHPNICTLHDVGSQDGVDFLVMEYLEGETLADRLRKKPLPLDQILKIGIEVTAGLEVAHNAGIIHRDLKPANIMLTTTGAKLMDFGLARTAHPIALTSTTLGATAEVSFLPGAPVEASQSAKGTPASASVPQDASTATHSVPPRAAPLTVVGTVVGTVQYMSPEQVDGKQLTPASDIFAFGAVLYEMVTGHCAFQGITPLSVASAILEKQPEPVFVSQPSTPASLEVIIRTCLAKSQDERYASAHDVRLQLKLVSLTDLAHDASPQGTPSTLRERALVTGLALALALALIAAGWLGYARWRQKPATRPVVESTLQLPQFSLGETFGYTSRENVSSLALSPDSQYIAFTVGASSAERRLWVRPLRVPRAYALPGTEGAIGAFWSPDGRFLAFFSAGQLKKVGISGGVVSQICQAQPYGGAWGPNGTIIFAGGPGEPLNQVSAAGGDPRPIPGTTNGIRPFFLPDGRHFLYVDWSNSSAESGVRAGSNDGRAPVDLGIRTAARAVYASGYIIYASGTQLLAQRFDAAAARILGGPQVLVEGGQPYFAVSSPFTVSENGLFAFRLSGGNGTEELQLHARDGHPEPSGIAPGYNNNPRFSPDGTRVAYDLVSGQNRDIWIFDLERRVNTRFTFGGGDFSDAVWSPDGKRIAFAVGGGGDKARIMAKALDGGAEEMLVETPGMVWARSWSPDGRYLFLDYYTRTKEGYLRRSIQAMDLVDKKTVNLAPDDRFDRRTPIISPDGRWLAYVSNVSGREEVYMQTFPGNGNRVQVSSAGGIMPRWRGDGREIYFITGNLKVAAVEITPKGDTVQLGPLRELFPVSPLYPGGNPLDVTRDGKLFVVDTIREGDTVPITLISNWDAGLQ